ncbi:hypothetical protein N657DRAFT_652860 [Parathielavia appendiculata]|uniref:non-specific serine/threonine protein kinase n=1 Tax=Parathielavia appendiculata TaxID=2587402 RepID=A0AAN6UDA2_9PEZI|nr:hypothetical protein N657DRAFT_652860 [Parathielavia appendiculata]
MRSVLKWARVLTRRAPLALLRFPTTGFEIISPEVVVEEQHVEKFKAGLFYPINIGDVPTSKCQILGRLGFGTTSTEANTSRDHQHVALKFQKYQRLSNADSQHTGSRYVRRALDQLLLPFTKDLLKAGIKMVLLALDYLHTECKLVHTDIKGDNIVMELVDKQVLDAFTEADLDNPTPRKFVEVAPWGVSVLSDLGSAVRRDMKRNHDAQPMWQTPIHGQDPSGEGSMTRVHLAEVVAVLGPPALDLLRRGVRSSEFFADDGRWIADVEIPQKNSLEASEERLEGENKARFLEFMRGMLQWRPEDRKTAKQLLKDPLLNSSSPQPALT